MLPYMDSVTLLTPLVQVYDPTGFRDSVIEGLEQSNKKTAEDEPADLGTSYNGSLQLTLTVP